MISYAVTFLVIALLLAVLGFTGVAGTFAWLAKICFFIFLLLFIVSFVTARRAA